MVDKQNRPPLILKIQQWPSLDRELWTERLGFRTGRLSERKHEITLSERSVTKYRESYGRFLGFLRDSGRLIDAARPGDRLNLESLAAYFDALRGDRNRATTIHGRLMDLKCALLILEPDQDFGWITRPGGNSLTSMLNPERLPKQCPDPVVLYEWGLKLMDTAHERSPACRPVYYRDGLMVALLAARAPRLRTLAAMEIGKNVFPRPDCPWISLQEEDLKVPRRLEYGLPASLEPYFDQYMRVERPRLLGRGQTDAFWLASGGRPLTYESIGCRVKILSKAAFGRSFGPHTFRYALGTKGALLFPDNPCMVAAVLGITHKTHEKYYNIAQTGAAAGKLVEVVDRERQVTRVMAHRIFAKSSTTAALT